MKKTRNQMKKILTSSLILIATLLSINVSALADSRVAENPTDFNEFGREGFEHRPNLITFEQASSFCSDVVTNTEGEDQSLYFRCVNSFKPFILSPVEGSSCTIGTVLNWGGGCTATTSEEVDSMGYIDVDHERNNDMFAGNARYRCMNGSWQLLSQTCVELPENCYAADNQDIEWPVTYPTWATTSGSNPKPACTGDLSINMRSLTLTQIKPDNTEYHIADSGYDLLCYDGSLTRTAIESRKQDCNYIPKDCNSKIHTYENCDFSVPATVHPYNLSNPSAPGTNISVSYDGALYHGDLSLQCFDGNWNSPTSNTCNLNPQCGSIVINNESIVLNNASEEALIADCESRNGVLSDITGTYSATCNYEVLSDTDLCNTGTYSVFNPTAGTWNCSNGRQTKNCADTGIISNDVANCGTANNSDFETLSSSNSNLCQSGDVSGFSKSGSVWNWNCVNSNYTEISTASCSANETIEIPEEGCFYVAGETFFSDYTDFQSSGPAVYVETERTEVRWNNSPIYYYYSFVDTERPELDENVEEGSLVTPDYLYSRGAAVGTTGDMYEVCRYENIDPTEFPSCGSANGSAFETAPTTNLCDIGDASTITDSGSTFDWSCSSGMNTVNCSATKNVVSSCRYNANNYISFQRLEESDGGNTEFYVDGVQIFSSTGIWDSRTIDGVDYVKGAIIVNSGATSPGYANSEDKFEICY